VNIHGRTHVYIYLDALSLTGLNKHLATNEKEI